MEPTGAVSSAHAAERPAPAGLDKLAAHALPLALYAITLLLEIPGLIFRFLIVGLAAIPVLWISGHSTDPAGWIALAAALFPSVWSVLALAYPLGTGWLWQAQSGGRSPSSRESEVFTDALAVLLAPHPDTKPPRRWFVLDEGDMNASVLGDALMVHRGLLDSPDLTPVLAHELGHLNSTDGRLTAALNRLAIRAPRQVPVTINPLRWIWRIAFYGLALQALAPAWAAWFRHREYAADRYAANLGQGPTLARCLETDALPYDCPIPYMAISGHTHPYTEHRIDRLQQLAALGSGDAAQL
jgi:Zn-dependent protease with chaperone function